MEGLKLGGEQSTLRTVDATDIWVWEGFGVVLEWFGRFWSGLGVVWEWFGSGLGVAHALVLGSMPPQGSRYHRGSVGTHKKKIGGETQIFGKFFKKKTRIFAGSKPA